MSPDANPAGRPRAVAVLGYLFLGIAMALAADGIKLAWLQMANGLPPGSGWVRLLVIMPQRLLPAIWVGTAGWGMLAGQAWSRLLVAALAALVLVAFAGYASTPVADAYRSLRIGVALGMLLLTGGATWYLFSSRADGWFRRGA